ncbi:flagellar hook-length control protein FliK [Bradyrhizobium sp. 190]|uniref:flagellar hook-length control protein FliK n=1 Tax=Bradyrhizobium sp. 190 TaxID=2782658 RepID=UPI001FF8D1F3|nr:flagellar hook-length control protein FliK [Bradyrhizobium sp. 190]MCK1515046.1 flagellar hook-length control protein FliK [Bradyrhizobium sp. 190]
MVSVTSEVSANASFQNAAARSARPDSEPSAGNDSFAALVASNNDNRTQDNAPAPRRSDDTQAAPDNRSRDNAAASDKAARNDSNDRNAAAKAQSDKARDDNKVDAKADTDKAATARRAKSKSDAPKADGAKSDETTQASSSDASPVTDQAETTQDGTAVVTADAIAVAIPTAATPAATASATSATDKATAPLAIAAAAIAASASLAAETAPAAPAAEATEAAAAVTQPATANAAQADGGAKTSAQGAVGQAVSAQATSADPSIAAGIAQAASVVAATPAATKAGAQLKNPDLARKGATTAVEQAGTTDTAAPATPAADTIVPAVTAPTEAAGKPKSENGVADAVKADASGNSIAPPAANAQAHAHLATSDIGQTPVNSSGNGLQAAGAIQTQQPASTTTPATAAQFTATAAASAPVPVSGLAMEIAASARSGKTRFEIRLDPAELGRIDVRIDIDRHGQMTSHLTVERPETLSMLRQDANQLQRALDNAGLSTGNGGLQFSLRDQSSQGQNDGNQSNPNAHRLVVSEEDSVPAIVAGRNYGRMLGASGGVDIRV